MEEREKKENKKIRIMTVIALTLIIVLGAIMCLLGGKTNNKVENALRSQISSKVASKKTNNKAKQTQQPTSSPTNTPNPYKYEKKITYEKGKLLSSHTISKGWSSQNRNMNMKVAGKIISGKENKGYILMPGKTFSWLKVVGNTTKEKGFKIAPVIVNRRHAEGYGGGVCQVASTLNSAIVDANLETHALKHSLPSSYIGPNDHEATVSYDSGKDLSFKNTFKFPINIKVSTNKGSVTVKVFKMKKKTRVIKVKNDAVDR